MKLMICSALVCALAGCRPRPPLPSCGLLPNGAEPLLQGGATVFIGEVHGTQEMETAVASMACHAAQKGIPLTVGVELPEAEQPHIDAYLESAGTPADKQTLLEGEVWRDPYQDGRQSRAVLALIDMVRALHKAGAQARVLATDVDAQEVERNRHIAETLTNARTSRKKDLLLVVGGMNHLWKTGNEQLGMGAGHVFGQNGLAVTVLKMTSGGGTQWSGKVFAYPASEEGTPGVQLRPIGRAFDGTLHFVETHASEPAANPPPGGWKEL